MNRSRTWLGPLALTALVAACGGGSSGAASTSTGSTSSTTSTGSTGGGGSGGGGGGGSPDCSTFLDEAASPVTIQIKNVRVSPVYIADGGYLCDVRYTIAGQGTNPMQAELTEFDAAVTCGGLQKMDGMLPPDCINSKVEVIEPGATLTIAWTGLIYRSRNMPAQCAASGKDVTCVQGIRPMPGQAQLTVNLYESATCSPPPGDCSNGAGHIEVPSGFTYPDDKTIEVIVN